MEEKSENPLTVQSITYWELVFEKEYKKIEKLLEAKKNYRDFLLEKPLEPKSIKSIEKITQEMNNIILLLNSTRMLKNAYLITTANMNNHLWKLQIENEYLKKEFKIDNQKLKII